MRVRCFARIIQLVVSAFCAAGESDSIGEDSLDEHEVEREQSLEDVKGKGEGGGVCKWSPTKPHEFSILIISLPTQSLLHIKIIELSDAIASMVIRWCSSAIQSQMSGSSRR